jgi:hypothetical protein
MTSNWPKWFRITAGMRRWAASNHRMFHQSKASKQDIYNTMHVWWCKKLVENLYVQSTSTPGAYLISTRLCKILRQVTMSDYFAMVLDYLATVTDYLTILTKYSSQFRLLGRGVRILENEAQADARGLLILKAPGSHANRPWIKLS